MKVVEKPMKKTVPTFIQPKPEEEEKESESQAVKEGANSEYSEKRKNFKISKRK